MACINLETCSFYTDEKAIGSGLGAIYKKKYCLDSSDSCARMMLEEALGSDFVPAMLYPGMQDVAREIIESSGRLSATLLTRTTKMKGWCYREYIYRPAADF